MKDSDNNIEIITSLYESFTDGLKAAFVIYAGDRVISLQASEDGTFEPRIGLSCALAPVTWDEFWIAVRDALNVAYPVRSTPPDLHRVIPDSDGGL